MGGVGRPVQPVGGGGYGSLGGGPRIPPSYGGPPIRPDFSKIVPFGDLNRWRPGDDERLAARKEALRSGGYQQPQVDTTPGVGRGLRGFGQGRPYELDWGMNHMGDLLKSLHGGPPALSMADRARQATAGLDALTGAMAQPRFAGPGYPSRLRELFGGGY